jgi:hypothetical protein
LTIWRSIERLSSSSSSLSARRSGRFAATISNGERLLGRIVDVLRRSGKVAPGRWRSALSWPGRPNSQPWP